MGDDILFGGQDRFDGDHLDGGGGQDQLYGGPGRDRLTDGDVSDSAVSGAGPGPDVMAGGAGSDVLSYQGRTRPVTVQAGGSADNGELGERDRTSGIEALLGGNADDVLIGDERPNTLAGGPGDDTLECGAGGDLVESPDVSVVVPRSCEQLFFEWDCNRNGCLRSLQVEAQPVTAGTGGLKLKIMCPYIYDASNIGCRGTTSLRETAGSHGQLGRGSFRHPADSSFWFRIPIALTTPGAQWWKQGLLTDTAAVRPDDSRQSDAQPAVPLEHHAADSRIATRLGIRGLGTDYRGCASCDQAGAEARSVSTSVGPGHGPRERVATLPRHTTRDNCRDNVHLQRSAQRSLRCPWIR